MRHTLDFALTENESMMTEFQQKKNGKETFLN